MKRLTVIALLATITISGAGCGSQKNTENTDVGKVAATGLADSTEEAFEKIKESTEEIIDDTEKILEDTEKSANDTEEKESEVTIPIESQVGEQDGFTKEATIVDKLAESDKGNILFSPLSLDFALGMVQAGAKNETKDAISNYLNTTNYSVVANNFLKYISEYDDSKNTVEVANSMWVGQDEKLKDKFKENIETNFKSEINKVDFSNADGTSKEINNWVDDKTHGLIKEIINPDSIDNSMKSILVNSLYFNSEWAEKWDTEDTKDSFEKLDYKTEMVDYINNTADYYYENSKATGFGCYYKNGMMFIGILPNDNAETRDFSLSDLDLEDFILSERDDVQVNARMPKLNFDYKSEKLTSILKDMGLSILFDEGKADLSDIIDENVALDSIVQKCKIELDELHTEAAAATSMEIKLVSMPSEIKDITLNRPYAFMIYDKENGQILFLGKVTNPNN